MLEDQRGSHGVGVDDAGEAHPAVRQLLNDSDIGEEVQTQSSVGFGDGHTEEAELAHLLHDVDGEAVVAFELRGDGNDLPGDEAPNGLDDLPPYVVEVIHGHRRPSLIASEKYTSAAC